jgi:hypothetical protein
MPSHFISFAAGAQNYYDAGKRLVYQATEVGLFSTIQLYTDEDLKKDTSFWTTHGEFVESNTRGYGYWLWKSYIIKKTMERLADGDTLMYLDCGCEIDSRKKHRIEQHLEMVKSSQVIYSHNCIEQELTKMDLLVKLDMVNHRYMKSYQHQAGAILFYISDTTRSLVNEWYTLGSDYHNIDDSPSIIPNISVFNEHRHDQSIFSLLTKKYNLFNQQSLFNCIEYIRNKTGASRIS